jgi:hypothetical protein
MSLGRRIVRKNQVLIQYVLFDLVVHRVADDQGVMQPECCEPFFRWIAPSPEAVAGAKELRGLFWSDSPLFGRRLRIGIIWLGLLIALGNARTGGRRLRGMARGLFVFSGRGPRGRRGTVGLLCHGSSSPTCERGFRASLDEFVKRPAGRSPRTSGLET